MIKRFLLIPVILLSAKSFAGPFTDSSKIGDLMMAMSPAYAFGMTMMEKDYTGTLQFTEQFVASQLTVEAIKSLQLETRPNGSDRKSFPSGHAAAAFSGAFFVHKRYGWKPALIPYAMAVATGWSRVQQKAHYWHDIAAGAAVSALYTWAFVDEYDDANGIFLNAGPDEIGLSYQTSF